MVSNNRIANVAIVGAAGTVGKFITESLLATGKHTVTAITREGSKSQMPSGVRAATINYDDPITIAAALQGQDFLVITLATDAPGGTQEKLIDGAAAAGVQWVMPNEYSPDFAANPKFGQKSLIGPRLVGNREYITSKGLNYIGLSSGFWYQYSLVISPACYGFDIANKTVTFIDQGEAKLSTSTWPQSGRAVAAALSLPIAPTGEHGKGPFLQDFRNRSLICHSFRVSQRDMLASILRVSGDKEADWTINYEPAGERHARGMKELQTKGWSGLATVLYTPSFSGDPAADLTESSHNKILGLPEESLDEATKEAIEMVKSGWTYK